jgi:hypothetical protein
MTVDNNMKMRIFLFDSREIPGWISMYDLFDVNRDG